MNLDTGVLTQEAVVVFVALVPLGVFLMELKCSLCCELQQDVC